jgi:hypothetical protein
MRRLSLALLLAAACTGIGWKAYQSATPPETQFSRYAPPGALLYLQAKNFRGLLAQWNASPEKQAWLTTSNYEVFSRSRLFLRLKSASVQFAVTAGLPPDMNFLEQVAGTRSALALYDIGKLHFLYITRLPAGNALQTSLWQARSKFETRSAGGATFYLRKDPESEREVEFAINDEYLLLATREDLMAGALQLMAGSKDRTIEDEPWCSQPLAAAGPEGDLRMVLNLDKIVPSPYFRSYWVQQNINDTKQYSAAITDLFRSQREYREDRVLLKKIPSSKTGNSSEGAQAVADLTRLLPEDSGTYEVQATSTPEALLHLLETKMLAPHTGAPPPSQTAPQVLLTSGETGTSTDLETRIDQPPSAHAVAEASSALQELMQHNPARAVLQVQSTEHDRDAVFIRMHSAVALLGNSDWDQAAVRKSIAEFIRSNLTASYLGIGWEQKNGYEQLDGLYPLTLAVRGKYLLFSDNPVLMSKLLARMNQTSAAPSAIFVAGFHHALERQNFERFMSLIDRPDLSPAPGTGIERQPQFFSENIASLSRTLSEVLSEEIVIRDAGDKTLQTVTYEWAQ